MTDEKPERSKPPHQGGVDGNMSRHAAGGRGARVAAAKGVQSVLEQKLPLDVALSAVPIYKDLSARDRAFARLISATALRRIAQINAAITPFIQREPSAYVKAVLATGAAQLLYLDTPVHAAVGESVAILKRARERSDANAAGMVNAVLRRVSEQGKALASKVSVEKNLPLWLQESWREAYGQDALEAIAAQLMKSPPLDLSVKSDPAHWAEQVEGEALPTGTVRKPQIGNIVGIPGFSEGAWWVQDVSAALPVHILGDLSGKKALDMCAAPGGKTLQLAAAGAEVTALDRSAQRLEKVKDNLERTGLSAKTVAVDAAKWRGLRDHDFDVVLLDAPCSATGTLRRRPDVAFTKSPKDVASLVQVQDRLLLAAARQVKAGGTLLYCTCSLQTEEGEDRVLSFLKARTDFRLNPILTASIGNIKESLTPEGFLRVLPHYLSEQGGMDGFFIAQLIRDV